MVSFEMFSMDTLEEYVINGSLTVCLYYAPTDHLYVHELKKHLTFLEKQGLLTFWQDEDIYPGTDFRQERLSHLNSADVVFIFVSPDFLASDLCFAPEMQQIMQRHASGDLCVIPILLRPVHWQGAPFSHLQPLPKNGVPISSEYWPHLDEALFAVTQEIVTVLQKLLGDQFQVKRSTEDPAMQPKEKPLSQKQFHAIFNQQGQSVHGNQYNASGDINLR
jgi:hypothetical protein